MLPFDVNITLHYIFDITSAEFQLKKVNNHTTVCKINLEYKFPAECILLTSKLEDDLKIYILTKKLGLYRFDEYIWDLSNFNIYIYFLKKKIE